MNADEAMAEARRLIDDPCELIGINLDVMTALVAEVERLRAALATARREGAEAMASRAEAACEVVRSRFAEQHASQWSDRRRAASGGACEGADLCAAAIRALPLDAPSGQHDDAGGES